MAHDILVFIGAILSSSAAAALVTAIIGRRKSDAETAGIEVKTISEALETMRHDSDEAHKRIDSLEEKLERAQTELRVLTISFEKLQQDFLESERAKVILQAAVIERDKTIEGLRRRVAELESQLAALKEKVNGQSATA